MDYTLFMLDVEELLCCSVDELMFEMESPSGLYSGSEEET